MTVRRLGEADVDHARAVLSGFTDADPDPAAFLAAPHTCLFVAEDAGETVGWLYGYELVRPDGRRAMLLYEVDVAEAFRRRGHGRALVDALLAEARARDCFEAWVLTEPGNEPALALYEATGALRDDDGAMCTWRLPVDSGR